MITTAAELQDTLNQLRHEGVPLGNVAVLHEKSSSVVPTLCALANMPEGGSIIFGLDDAADYATIGVLDPDTLEQTLETLAHHIEPALHVLFYRATVDGQQIVVANVHGLPLQHRPSRVIATNKAYLRGSNGNHVLSPHEIYRLQTALEHARYDMAPVEGATQEHLDPERTTAFLQLARNDVPQLRQATDEDILRAKGVMEPAGARLTVAGLYVLGDYPQQFFPNLTLTAVRRATDEPDQPSQPQRFDGPLPELIENAVRWVVRHIRTPGRNLLDAAGYRSSKIPIMAIREVIANALIHRDLSAHALGNNVEVTLEDDLLTVTNPGGLWNVSADQLGQDFTQSAVNPVLYEICRLTTVSGGHRIVESTRRGLAQVHHTLRRVAMHPPRYADSGLYFKVTLGRRIERTDADQQWLTSLPDYETLTSTQQYLVIAMSHAQQPTLEGLQQEFGPDENRTIIEQLQELVERGLVTTPDRTSPGYRLHDAWKRKASPTSLDVADFRPSKSVAAEESTAPLRSVSEPEPATDDLAQRAAATSKHGAKLWEALDEGPHDIHTLAGAAGLSLSQTRYAMQRLVADELVDRSGGQGHRQTLYTQAVR